MMITRKAINPSPKEYGGVMKRYYLSVIEEMIQNPKHYAYRGGRIEIYDEERKDGYAVGEARFLIPEDMIVPFRKLFDGYETDIPIRIDIDMFRLEKDDVH